jgi:amidophosphoribosyltransferase
MDGIAAIYSPKDPDLVQRIFIATGMCQHRGKASAGIAVGNGKGIYVHKGLGRIGDVVHPDMIRVFQDLGPVAAIGNVGYTKRDSPEEINAEPIKIHPRDDSNLEVVLTMDGYLVKEDDIKAGLSPGYEFETGNKTEVMGAMLHKCLEEEGITFEAGSKFLESVHGRATFALAALVYDKSKRETYLITLNDSRAFEPFCFGKIGDAFVASSESVSHTRLGMPTEREYNGAEMTVCSPDGIHTKRLMEEEMMPDIFQAVYFGHVGSLFRGKEIFEIRRELGHGLVSHYGDSDANIVIPNPDSGWGVTIGLYEGIMDLIEREGLDFSHVEDEKIIRITDMDKYRRWRKMKTVYPALIKQAQAVRTFQEATSRQRSLEVGLKFGGVGSLLEGKIVAMGDDSIVRGSVSEGGSVAVVRNCGAKEVEFWISYGPMFFPSFKGWHKGMSCVDELAVQRAFKDLCPYSQSHDEINRAVAKLVGVDKVRYNTLGVIEHVAGKGSFQAMDASYPIDRRFWPDWIRREVDKFHSARSRAA